jgi:tetratricopeptide (TPR) repeat protein
VLRASASGVEFVYRDGQGRFYRIRATPSAVHAMPSGEPETMRRLVRALGLRLGQQPEAAEWIAETSARARSLSKWKTFHGSGESLPPMHRACDALLQRTASALADGGREPGQHVVELEAMLAELSTMSATLGATLDSFRVLLWLALGEFDRALRHWASVHGEAQTTDRGDPWAHARVALMSGFRGRASVARTAIEQLVASSRDSEDLRLAGELYMRLDFAREAYASLRQAAGEHDDFASWRRVASSAAQAKLHEHTREAAWRMVERARQGTEMFEAAMSLREAGAFIDAERVLERLLDDPQTPKSLHAIASLELARSYLWRLELEQASRLVRELSNTESEHAGPAARILGAAAVLAGRHDEALELLDRAIALHPRDDEALLWRARAHIGRDELEAADADLVRANMGDRTSWQLLAALVREQLVTGSVLAGRERYFIQTNLRQLLGDSPGHWASASIIEQIEAALARLGGNLGARLTSSIDAPDRLRWLDEVESPRARAEHLQLRLIHDELDAVLAEFQRFAEECPDVPTAVTYAAELCLWNGDYARASSMFEAVWATTRTRWGYVGGGAAAVMLGRHERALELWAEGAREYTYMIAEATYAYRGELYLARGELDRARSDLEHAVTAKPFRLGAWVVLGLLHARVGDAAGLRRCFAQVEALAPVLVHLVRPPGLGDTSPAEQEAILSAALVALRGNRSTVLYSFYVDDQLHVVQAGALPAWQTLARRMLEAFAEELVAESCWR